MIKRISIALLLVVCASLVAAAQQRAEVTISLNEAFFDAALEGLFQNGAPLEFAIASNGKGELDAVEYRAASFSENKACNEVIRIQREINGIRSAVRFRDGKILVPLAFSGNYNPPLIGCVPFSGWAESVVDLAFDEGAKTFVARVRVLNVNLSGSGGIGGTVIARLVQSSIDKKVNPINLIHLDKLSMTFPVQGSSGLKMTATGIRHELHNGSINVVVGYEFTK